MRKWWQTLAWLPRLLTAWSLLALLTLAVLLTHHSDEGLILGRYSLPVLGMLGGLAGAALFGLVAAVILHRRPALLARLDAGLRQVRQRRYLPAAILLLAGGAMAGIWLLVLGNHLPTYAMLRFFLTATVALAAVGALYGGDTATPSPAAWRWLAWGGVALLVLIALATVSFYPAHYRTDEALIFSMGRNLLESGHNGTTIYRHTYPLDDGRGGLWTWGLAAWLRVGGVSFTAGRLHFLLVGLLTVGLTVVAARRLYDRTAALFTALLGVFAVTALTYIRYDMPSAFWLALALVFFSQGQQRTGWWPHLLAGLAAGLCLDSAPIGYCFGLGFALFYLGQYVGHIRSTRRWLWPAFWLLVAGGILALLVYAITRTGASYHGTSGSSTLTILSGYAAMLGESLSSGQFIEQARQFLTTWLTQQPLLFGLALLGIITALRERAPFDQLLLVLLATWTAVMIFAFHYFPVFYLIHSLPITLALAARALTHGVPWLLGTALPGKAASMTGLSRAVAVLLLIWLLAATLDNLTSLTSLEDVVAAGEEIAQIVPEEAVIVAAEPYYFGMLDHRQFVGGAIEGMLVTWEGLSPAAAWELVAPQAVVFSERWPEPPPTAALLVYLEARDFILRQCWQTRSYGRIELWTAEDSTPGLAADAPCLPVCVPRWGCD